MIADPSSKPERRWDIDWLRVLAVLLLYPFHTARVFDIWEEFYAKNQEVSEALTTIVGYFGPWHMPLFFLLAGASTWFALRFRSGREYTGERFKRLLVPFIFGVLVIIPPQSYLGLRLHSDYAGSFLRWFPNFFRLMPQDMDGYFLGGHTWGQLWFIFHLFVYSLAALPLFLYFNRESGQRLIDRLAAFCTRPGMIFVFCIPLVLVNSLFYLDIAGGNPLFYILLFIYGFILMADPRFGEAIDRHKAVALVLGPVVYLVPTYFNIWGWPTKEVIPVWFLRIYILGFTPWFFMLAILGYGRQFLNFSNRFLKYAAGASYPFYILHQTAIVVIGFYVVQWDASVLVKFLTIVVASFVATAVVYDLLVKRINVVRFLFGMRPRKKPVSSLSPGEATT
jgi:peptidoglycan/LPS O-acetylase OafA/YrhL